MAENGADNASNKAANEPAQRNQQYAFQQIDRELYARLKTEAKAPYRGLRKFIYVTFGASGLIGGFIFLTQLLAGREVEAALPNFALQMGVVALMVWLYRIDKSKRKS